METQEKLDLIKMNKLSTGAGRQGNKKASKGQKGNRQGNKKVSQGQRGNEQGNKKASNGQRGIRQRKKKDSQGQRGNGQGNKNVSQGQRGKGKGIHRESQGQIDDGQSHHIGGQEQRRGYNNQNIHHRNPYQGNPINMTTHHQEQESPLCRNGPDCYYFRKGFCRFTHRGQEQLQYKAWKETYHQSYQGHLY